MIPKSVIETTIHILESNLDEVKELLESNKKEEVCTIKVYSVIKLLEPKVAMYKLLISEHKKYLEENYIKRERPSGLVEKNYIL